MVWAAYHVSGTGIMDAWAGAIAGICLVGEVGVGDETRGAEGVIVIATPTLSMRH